MIGFRNQERIIDEIVADLVDAEYAQSWNLTLPPGFGDDRVMKLVIERIRNVDSSPLLAEVTSDSVPDVLGYIKSLHRQWSRFHELEPLPTNLGASEMFDSLLAMLPNDRPVIQVIRRFHKVLDCLDVWFLGKLRDAEQHKRLRTFTATPLSLDELKKRWEAEGHILVVSDYGDTHTQHDVEVTDEADVFTAADALSIPAGVAAHILALTGGHPEPFESVVNQWLRWGTPQLTHDVRRLLKSSATKCFSRFVKWLDCRGMTIYRDSVINLYQGFESEVAYQRLGAHPWRRILFDDEFGLRAECLGEAAVLDAVRSAAIGQKPEHAGVQIERRAREMYRRKQYHAALTVYNQIPLVKTVRPDLALLEASIRVMGRLYEGESPEDTDWRAVLKEVRNALDILESHKTTFDNAEFLESRLSELKNIAEALKTARASNDVRLVDALSGLGATDKHHPKAAAVLLLLKYESCSTIPGHASACQAALYLPEQIFRVWGLWCLGINYYEAPAGADMIWVDAESEWPTERRDKLARPAPGERFPSLLAYAYFSLAKLLRDRPEHLRSAPIRTFKELESGFSLYERLRNPKAHSYCSTSAKDRKMFFTLIDDWLDCLIAVCPDRVTRSQLQDLIAPLPIVDRHGALVFG